MALADFNKNQQKMDPNEVYSIKIALKYLALCTK